MPVMYYDRIPSLNIRWQWFFWDYISVHNSNLCNHCMLTMAIYISIHVHAQRVIVSCSSYLMIRFSFGWSGGFVVFLRESVGEERLIWRQFCTSPSMFCNNRRLRQGQVHHYSYDFSYVFWKGQLDSQVIVRSQVCQRFVLARGS